MSFQYIKQNKGKNIGIFVSVEENKEVVESIEKVEPKDESLEDWNNIAINERVEDCDHKSSNSSDVANSKAEIKE